MMARALIVGWLFVSLGAVAYLHRLHRTPVSESYVSTGEVAKGDLQLRHILAPQCGCSKILVDYLVERGVSEFPESVFLVEDAPSKAGKVLADRLSRAGFPVRFRKAHELPGLPLLEIFSAQELVYRGGYTHGAITPLSPINDVSRARALVTGRAPAAHLAYGCALSQQLLQSLDPLGVKGL